MGGCARLTVPLGSAGAAAHFIIDLATPVDFTGATITAEVIAPAAQAGALQAFVQHGADAGYSQSFLGWKKLDAATSWTTLSWNVSGTFDNTGITRLGMSVENGIAADASASFEQPATVVYIASIEATPTNPSIGPYSFASSTSVAPATPKYPTGLLWLNTDDTPVAGSSLDWVP
jgi:hypothetical protein